MKEYSIQQSPEYPIGSIVPILQHSCASGKLGLKGTVNALNGSVPATANCLDCHKSISVDVQALSGSKGKPQ